MNLRYQRLAESQWWSRIKSLLPSTISNIKPWHFSYITVQKWNHTHTFVAITLAHTNAILFHWPRSNFFTAEFGPQGCVHHSNRVVAWRKKDEGKRGKTGLLLLLCSFRMQLLIKVVMEGLGAIFWQKGQQQAQKGTTWKSKGGAGKEAL